MIDDSTRPRLSPTVTGRDLGDEYVFLDASGERLHVLNGVAREIVLLCDGQHTTADLAHALTERFTVDDATALGDVRQVVDQLLQLGVLTPD